MELSKVCKYKQANSVLHKDDGEQSFLDSNTCNLASSETNDLQKYVASAVHRQVK